MILEKIYFKEENYDQILKLKEIILKNGEDYGFYRWEEDSSSNPEIIHTDYPHKDDGVEEITNVTLYLWNGKKEGEVSFITSSGKSYEDALQAVKDLIGDPSIETRSGIETVVELEQV